jgi:pimeloyl-ACP methyl ester carboxylesterase
VPLITAGQSGRHSARAHNQSEPFQTFFAVPVAGGALNVARSGSPPEVGAAVVLALHGMTGSHMVYRTVARELCGNAPALCVLAPDLRGRGASARLPEPYGMATHIADLIAVLDHVGARRAILVGHSMGCNIAARFGAEHPERTAAIVLLDGGLPPASDMMIDGDDDGEPPEIFARFEMTFPTVDDYLDYWRGHPALRKAWDEDIDAFVRRDFVEDHQGARCVVNQRVALTDAADLVFDGVTWTALTRVRAPVRLLRAERGMYDDDPIIPLPDLDHFLPDNPHVSVELVPDVNHFTLVIGGGHGPGRVAATIAELASAELSGG